MTERPLTFRQRRFAEAVPFARSATEAARIAGYAVSDLAEVGSQNIRNSKIMAAAEQAIQSAAEQAGVSPLWALERLKEHREAAIAEKQFGPANTAVELIGKHLRMFGEPQQVQLGDTYNQVVLQGFTVEQLRELLAASRQPAVAGDSALVGQRQLQVMDIERHPELAAPSAEAQPPLRTDPGAPAEGKRLTKGKPKAPHLSGLPTKGKRASGVGRRELVGGVKEGGQDAG